MASFIMVPLLRYLLFLCLQSTTLAWPAPICPDALRLEAFSASLDTCTTSLGVCLASSRAAVSATSESDPVFNTEYRSTMEIVWSCLTIIFASTWICVHPNVVGRDTTEWQRLGKRLKLFTLAVLAPELLAVWAFFQWKGCRELHKEFRDKAIELGISLKLSGPVSEIPATDSSPDTQGEPKADSDAQRELPQTGSGVDESGNLFLKEGSEGETEPKRNPWYWYYVDEKETAWTLTHAHFIQMGGIVFKDEKGNIGFQEPALRREVRVLEVTEGDFKRVERGWSDEDLKSFFSLRLPEAFITDKSKGNALAKVIVVTQVLWFTTQTVARKLEGLPITHLEVVCLAFTVFNLGMYVCWWDKPLDVEYPLEVPGVLGPSESGLSTAQKWIYPLFLGLDSLPVGQWTSSSPERFYPSLYTFHPDWDDEEGNSSWTHYFTHIDVGGGLGGGFTLALAFTSASFGALHAVGWSLPSPSHAEKMLWHVSCIVLVVYPLIPMICAPLLHLILHLGPPESVEFILVLGLSLVSGLGVITYFGARLILIVLPFLELRALPPLAHQAISWSNFLPHV